MAYRPPHRQSNLRKQPSRQQQQPAEQTNLDWLPSVSRSGGLDGDGDSCVLDSFTIFDLLSYIVRLKDHRIQERYRAWIEEKVRRCATDWNQLVHRNPGLGVRENPRNGHAGEECSSQRGYCATIS
jgi:hypothetical protein